MRKKGKPFFTVDQLIYIEGMTVLENHQFATIAITTDSAKNHP